MVGTLAEHAIAQWRIGERRLALATLCEAVELLINIREETTAWKALFYQIFSVLTIYSNVVHDGTPGNGFHEPQQGWFTANHEDLATGFRPEQVAYICIRVAKFGDGIGELKLANEWTWKALARAEGHAEGWRVVCYFAEYGLTWELLENHFEQAGKLCVFHIRVGTQEILADPKPTNGIDATQHPTMLANIAASASVPAMSLARLKTVMPIVFRVTTRVVRGSSDIEAAITALESQTSTAGESEGFAGCLRWCFLEPSNWQTLRDEAFAAHEVFQYLKSYTLMLGAVLKSPAKQSLYLQVKIMQTLSRVFSERSQLHAMVIAPFFVEYWKAQAAQVLHPFRTAQSHTLRQLELSDGTIAETRKLLSAMRFCLGADLPKDAMSWLESEA